MWIHNKVEFVGQFDDVAIIYCDRCKKESVIKWITIITSFKKWDEHCKLMIECPTCNSNIRNRNGLRSGIQFDCPDCKHHNLTAFEPVTEKINGHTISIVEPHQRKAICSNCESEFNLYSQMLCDSQLSGHIRLLYKPMKYTEEHKHASGNRTEIERSKKCGCFNCLAIFEPTEIKEWIKNEDTAICPHCGVDSVLADSEVEITEILLSNMAKEWFGEP